VAAEFLGVDSERQIRSLTGYGQAFCDAVIGFLAGVSPDMHDFWNESAERRMNDVINITKNMALAGGAIALMGVEEPWPASVPVLAPKPNIVKALVA
jgi:hypothetical protein